MPRIVRGRDSQSNELGADDRYGNDVTGRNVRRGRRDRQRSNVAHIDRANLEPVCVRVLLDADEPTDENPRELRPAVRSHRPETQSAARRAAISSLGKFDVEVVA